MRPDRIAARCLVAMADTGLQVGLRIGFKIFAPIVGAAWNFRRALQVHGGDSC